MRRFLVISFLLINLGIGSVILIYFLFPQFLFSYSDFRVTYDGALSGEFTGKGHFVSCVGSPLRHEITLFRKPKPGGIHLSLPVNLTPGTYAFSKSGSPGTTFLASVDLDDENGEFYVFSPSDLVSGTIVLDVVPNDSGDPIRGQFSISVYRRELSGVINIQGSFDFLSSGDSDYECLR